MATLQSELPLEDSVADHFESQESSTEEEAPPPKKTKFSGAFIYKTRYSKDWQKKWPFVTSVPGDQHSFRCTLCSKNLKCGHQGAADVSHHIATKGHQQIAKGLATQSKITFQTPTLTKDKVTKLYCNN